MDKQVYRHEPVIHMDYFEEKKGPLYSICICNYNMADTLELSLSSLMAQLDDRFEVVVVDDGSSDKSVEVLEKLAVKYPMLRVIPLERDSKRKLGFTRNRSIEEARGEFVLLHLDCDDVFGPHIRDFVEVFHRLEECIGQPVLVAGQHINMANRDFLLSHGPYVNIYRGEDRNLWNRLSRTGSYIPLDHIDFITRLPKTRSVKIRKTFKDTLDHMTNDFRGGNITLRKYLAYEVGKFKTYSLQLFLLRVSLLIPARIMAYFDGPLPDNDLVKNHDDFAAYRESTRGTFPELMRRYGGDPDLSFLDKAAQRIFS